jgi:predicted enzyme related to lactoylglutathione lyase
MNRALSHITLHAANVWGTVEWYEKVFGLTCTYLAPDGSYAELSAGGVTLGIASHQFAQETQVRCRRNSLLEDPPGVHLCFTTADVPAQYQLALDHGGVPLQPPGRRPWGRLEASIRDPNGIVISLLAPSEQPGAGKFNEA